MDPPVNVSVISFTYSFILFVWTPPLTLQVSHENTTGIVYEVTIMTPANGNDTLSTMVMEPEFIYHRHDFVHCSKITLNVAAINEVGRGNKSKDVEAAFLGRK